MCFAHLVGATSFTALQKPAGLRSAGHFDGNLAIQAIAGKPAMLQVFLNKFLGLVAGCHRRPLGSALFIGSLRRVDVKGRLHRRQEHLTKVLSNGAPQQSHIDEPWL
jgi:hypothetical protein